MINDNIKELLKNIILQQFPNASVDLIDNLSKAISLSYQHGFAAGYDTAIDVAQEAKSTIMGIFDETEEQD